MQMGFISSMNLYWFSTTRRIYFKFINAPSPLQESFQLALGAKSMQVVRWSTDDKNSKVMELLTYVCQLPTEIQSDVEKRRWPRVQKQDPPERTLKEPGPATPDPCPIPEQGHVGRAGLLCLDPRRRFSQAHPMPPKVRYPVLGLWVFSPTLNVAGAQHLPVAPRKKTPDAP